MSLQVFSYMRSVIPRLCPVGHMSVKVSGHVNVLVKCISGPLQTWKDDRRREEEEKAKHEHHMEKGHLAEEELGESETDPAALRGKRRWRVTPGGLSRRQTSLLPQSSVAFANHGGK